MNDDGAESSVGLFVPADVECFESAKSVVVKGGFLRRLGQSATLLLCLWMVMSVPAVQALVGPDIDAVRNILRARVETIGTCPVIAAGGEICHSSPVLPVFYEKRLYHPAWVGDSGISPQARTLLQAIRQSSREGLNPRDYHLDLIESLMEKFRRTCGTDPPASASLLADIDLLLTDAFLVYGSHLSMGRIDPLTIQSTWFSQQRQFDLLSVLDSALLENRIEESLLGLRPADPAYRALLDALPRYRAIVENGGWPAVPEGAALKPGMTDERVLTLRMRIFAELGNAPADVMVPSYFDRGLESALKELQRRYGLDHDGVAGGKTIAALNVPAEARVNQIIANMERWRWLPHTMEDRYLLVNIADQKLAVVENGANRLEMRVVVGMPYWSTPVFSSVLSYLVFNPYWNVPPRIARMETLPKARKDPFYLAKNRLRIVSGWKNPEIVDPSTIDWATVRVSQFPYRFRQDPGPDNSLGRVKFLFPNKFDVYLHDTPAKELFAKTGRAFSHGCIRLEKPLELAEYLLRDPDNWSMENILKVIETDEPTIVRLPRSIPVHILYWTAWADDSGAVCFRDDIYGRDEALMKVMREQPPTA